MSLRRTIVRIGRGSLAAIVLLATTAPVWAQLTPQQRQLNIDSFEYVWKTVRDKHWQTKPGGLDWQAVHDELRPAIEKADSMAAARAVMNDMLDRLHQTHFGVIPADLYSGGMEGSSGKGESTTGIDVRLVGSQVLVTSVEKGSSAAEQGVKPGWQILKVAGTDLGPVVEKIIQTTANSTLRDISARRAILARMEGKAGDSIQVEFLDGKDQHVTKTIVQGKPRGTLTQFGYLYPMYVWFESSKVAGNIGYVSFNMFLDAGRLMNLFADAVQSCAKCDGFIIDLRGNPGGIGGMAMGMAGWFIDKPDQRLGVLTTRTTDLKFVINPRLTTFSGPLAILVDGASASTSEILAGGLKDLGRARVFGTKTAAAALPSMFEKLPNGDGFQYAIANYVSEGGKPLEGLGVTPDVETPVTRQALLEGKDPALDAAIDWIKKK